jgi:glycerate kinase
VARSHNPLVALRIVVAPQAFKGSADAYSVATAIADGLREVWPDAVIELLPVADGGEGTVRALVEATKGEYRTTWVRDPLGRSIEARWGLIDRGRTAVIEMAAASGLPLLAPSERDPLRASTFGTGELIKAAAETGARKIVIGIGGSATNDGGAGMLRALGLRFLDSSGAELSEGGAALTRLAKIEGEVDAAVRGAELVVATDVRNPLCGPEGASAVFGPQKGAAASDVRILDEALAHFADLVRERVGTDLRDAPGAGAAGGVGFALIAVLGASMRPGAELVLDAARFDERIRATALCVTGEGRLDGQSLYGKASITVARRATAMGVRVAAVVGALGPGHEAAWSAGISAVEALATGPVDQETLMRDWRPLTRSAAARLARVLQLGRELGTV